jgi:hypothetical protein
VQRPLHRHPGVLEPGEVHDADDLVLSQGPREQGRVHDGPLDERHPVGDEAAATAGQVVDDDAADPLVAERADHVGAYVAGTSGHQPGHRRSPSVTCCSSLSTVLGGPLGDDPSEWSRSGVTARRSLRANGYLGE